MEKKTLRVGLVGYGMIGKVHAYATAVLPWYAPELPVVGKIVAVATQRMETAQRAQEQIGAEVAYDDYRRIMDDPTIDVVHLCAPNAEHFPALVAAIRAKKHIYCEKPLVATTEEARELRRILAENDYRQTCQIAHHLRGFAALRRAKELIDAGKLGQIVQYRLGYYHSSALDPTAPWRWKHDAKGGAILDLASHLLDLVDWLVGLPAEAIAQSSILVPSRPISKLRPGATLADAPSKPVLAEDAVAFMTRGLRDATRSVPNPPTDKLLEYPAPSGSDPTRMPLAIADPADPRALTGVVEATKLMNGAEDELKLEISGTRGSLRFSLMDSHYLEYFDATVPYGDYGGDAGWKKTPGGGRYPAPETDFPSPKSAAGWLRAHVASLAAFYRGIADGKVYGADFEQGLKIQDALTAIAESAKRRTWVKLA